jgi:hypothetical protein
VNVHPDDLSNWCRVDVCSECHDEWCQHDCHVEVLAVPAEVRRVNWLRFVLLYVCLIAVTMVAYRLVDYAVTDTFELPAQLVTLVLLVFYVFPVLERWFYRVAERQRGRHGE